MDKLKVGVLGLGRGITHLRSFLNVDDAVVVGVCDRHELRRNRASELLKERDATQVPILEEFDDLLALKPDAVVIASNGKSQVGHACQAMEAGCAVLSEVPGADTVEEIVHLRDTVERTGRFYMLAENSAFADFLRYWRKWVMDGRLGAISLGEAEYVHYLPNTLSQADGTVLKPSDARGRNDVRPVWRADQPPIQYLTHDLGPLLEVLDDRVVAVNCVSGPWWSAEAPLRADGQYALFETAKGSLLRILVTLNTYMPSEHRYRLLGTDGGTEHFRYEGFTRRFDRSRDHKEGWERLEISNLAPGASGGEGHGGKDLYLAKVFTRCILEGKPSPIDVYRMIDYSLPGIIANKSAEAGGTKLSIPNLRHGAFTGTRFWDTVPLPAEDPPAVPYTGSIPKTVL